MSKPILAYRMHPAITKDVLLAEMAEHRKHDRLVAGDFGNDHDEAFRGCSVGCLNFSINRLVGDCTKTSSFEHLRDRAGFPVALVSLHERLFEWLPAGRRDSWPTEFLEAIAPGADLTLVPWQFLGWLYAEKMVALFPENDPYQARAALAAFTLLLSLMAFGLETHNSKPETVFTPAIPATYFDSTEWVCASNDYAPETWLRVEFQGRVIEVRVAGAGPFRDGQPVHGAIDLGQPAFAALAPLRDGRIAVTVEQLKPEGQN
jgi:hypothetical protein